MNSIEEWIERLLTDGGISDAAAPYLRLLILLVVLALLSAVAYWITKRIFVTTLYRFFKKTSITWDDALVDHQVFNKLAHVVPALFVRVLAVPIFKDFEQFLPLVMKFTDSYLIVVALLILLAFMKVVEISLGKTAAYVDKPLTSYFQVIRIILYIATGILVLSVLIGKSPVYFLSAFGAMTAIILLIFKDTILGLVASVQIASNDMVKVGDWVEMPKFNADGDVISITLHTVKIQNWDKTLTTVPTYFFVTDSFKNWRGMQESGGRRIKRSIFVNVRTIRFVDPETRLRFKNYSLLTTYIQERQQEIELHNAGKKVDTSVLINGRRMTNIGVFRRYVENYLRSHPHIRKDMTLLVRQMPIEDRGVPIEVYCFTDTTEWASYEEIQADIFDHLLAAIGFFDLEVFQQPSGSDFSRLSPPTPKA